MIDRRARFWPRLALPEWPPRDWRMLLALLFLAGGGVACTWLVWAIIAALTDGAWPEAAAPLRIRWLGYLGLGLLFLIAIVLTSYGFVLGRRAWRARGPAGFEFDASGGEEEAQAGPAAAQP